MMVLVGWDTFMNYFKKLMRKKKNNGEDYFKSFFNHYRNSNQYFKIVRSLSQ